MLDIHYTKKGKKREFLNKGEAKGVEPPSPDWQRKLVGGQQE